MDVEAEDVDAALARFDRAVLALGEVRAAIKAALSLGQGESRHSAARARPRQAARHGVALCRACRGGSFARSRAATSLSHLHTRVSLMPTGVATSDEAQEQLLSLDRAVQGAALQLQLARGGTLAANAGARLAAGLARRLLSSGTASKQTKVTVGAAQTGWLGSTRQHEAARGSTRQHPHWQQPLLSSMLAGPTPLPRTWRAHAGRRCPGSRAQPTHLPADSPSPAARLGSTGAPG
jgi:hypothetical protein